MIFTWTLLAVIALVLIVGHILLLRSAWRLRHQHDLPANIPQRDPRREVGWSLLTALGTMGLLIVVAQSLVTMGG